MKYKMMNIKSYFCAATLVMLAACSNQEALDKGSDNGVVAPTVMGSIGDRTETRVVNNQWTFPDKIGITGTSGKFSYSNVQYNYAGDSQTITTIFKPSSKIIYFGAEEGRFTAYYPYTEDRNMITETVSGQEVKLIEADLTNQRNSMKFDFLFAKEVTANKSDRELNLVFRHKMCNLILHMRRGEGISKNNSLSNDHVIRLDKLYPGATFNPWTGEVAPKGDPVCTTFIHQKNISSVGEPTGTEGAIYGDIYFPFILAPQKIDGGLILYVTQVEDKNAPELQEIITYKAVLKTDDNVMQLEAGKKYEYTVTVNKRSITVDNTTIEDWIPADLPNNGEVDAEI